MRPTPDKNIAFFARTNFRNRSRVFGVKQADRRFHMLVIGKTGSGKSTLLEQLVRQDIAAGRGLCLVDPHGDLANTVYAKVPTERRGDLVYFNVPDRANPLGFNPLERVAPEKRPLAASGLLDAFRKLWADSWGPRLEHILRNALLLLLDQPEATLADVLRLLSDGEYRKTAATRTANAQVRQFWLREYESYPVKFRVEAIAPIQNKVGAFLADPVLHRIVTQPRSSFDLRTIMDEGRILLVNLSKGKIGEDTSRLLGALLVARLGLAAMSRADVPESQRRPFLIYLDEFPSYTTLSLATMLSELRKFGASLVLVQQHLSQTDPQVRDAILGNVGTIISFRLGMADAEVLEKEFLPAFSATDLVNLPNHRIYLKLMVDGVVSQPFSAETIRPAE